MMETMDGLQLPPELRDGISRRLARIEGQVRGLQRMVSTERHCMDVLIQLSAAQEALRRVSLLLLRNHMETCVVQAIERDDPGVSDELMALLKRFSLEKG